MKGHKACNQDSGNAEYYTRPHIAEAARAALGGVIDLDPASCEAANRILRAKQYFTKDGLARKWFGHVWMNHPFAKGQNHLWVNKLVASYIFGDVSEACCITWASLSEKWARPLLLYPQCFPRGRVTYIDPEHPEKDSAPKGSVITYLGKHTDRFAEAFGSIGIIKVPLLRP